MTAQFKTYFAGALALLLSLQFANFDNIMAAENLSTDRMVTPSYSAGSADAVLLDFSDMTLGMDKTGQILKGWQIDDEEVRYFDENGIMATGFTTIDETTYYFDENGLLLNGSVEIDNTVYLLQEDGSLLNGWISTEEGTSWHDETGHPVTEAEKRIQGEYYYFDENGTMVTSTEVNGIEYGSDGKATTSAYDRIAQAALAQLGVNQDCTMLVTNSLKAVGINFHGAPEKYLQLGPMTDNPVPGDIIVYSGHVAIYIGDGMAVHGGWNGYTTAIFTVECSTPLIGFVHPDLPNY